MSNPSNSALYVKSIPKAFRILEAFRDGDTFLGLTDLVQITGMDKSSVQRFAYTLRHMGYLEQDPATRRYSIGRRVLDLSFTFLSSHSLIARATPALVDLRQAVQERVDMSIPDGTWVLYVVRMQAKREHYSAALVGRRIPMFCTAGGRAMLAAMPEEVARRLVEQSDRQQHTAYTLTDVDSIMAEVALTRERGYAIQSSEWRAGELAAAVAITNKQGEPVAAIHVAVSTSDWTPADMEARIVPLLTTTGASISGR